MTNLEATKQRSVLLVGGPDAGKSNFLGRLWMALDSGTGFVTKNGLPSQMEYVRQLAESLLKGEFARHSSHGLFQENIIPVKWPEADGIANGNLIIPDCAGEQWERIHRLREWTEQWETPIRSMVGCLLFFRAGSSHHVPALDWATAEATLACLSATSDSANADEPKLPTQVVLVDWLQCLRSAFTEVQRPIQPMRLSIVVSAWDRVPPEQQAAGPDAYVDSCVPLLHDFISANRHAFETRIFGVSVVGGDLTDAQPGFKDAYLQGEPYKSGYAVYSRNGTMQTTPDLTIPLAWAFGCPIEAFH